VSDEPPGGLGGAIPLGPGSARPPAPVPLPAPRPAQMPDHLAEHMAEAVEPVALDARRVDPDARPPAGFARLSVHPAYDERGQKVFWLKGHSGDADTWLESERPWLPPTDLVLHKLRRDGDGPPPSEVLLGLAEWSEVHTDVVRWINALRTRHGAELQLVIWDDTDYDIPWELLNLSERHEGGLAYEVLGALVTVVRWGSSLHASHASPFGTPASCSGNVLGYYAEEMARDAEAFENFEHVPHIGPVEPFLAELTQPGLGAGLVYMGCHATHGARLDEVTLARKTWSELRRRSMPSLTDGNTLVCLNACDSARPLDNHGRGDHSLRSFPELFLRKGAGACIATSGTVGDDVAHRLIRDLVDQVCTDPELPVARALREFRARAVARLPDRLPTVSNDLDEFDAPGQRPILLFLYSFMFLYFGHPSTTLRLSVRSPEVSA
jgi:hypothetical protein